MNFKFSGSLLNNFLFQVEWNYIDYNIGNYFDGTIFTAPTDGLYSFYATARCCHRENWSIIYLFVNGDEYNFSSYYTIANSDNVQRGVPVTIQTTLKLEKSDKVEVRLEGGLSTTLSIYCIYFEGRLISRIDE